MSQVSDVSVVRYCIMLWYLFLQTNGQVEKGFFQKSEETYTVYGELVVETSGRSLLSCAHACMRYSGSTCGDVCSHFRYDNHNETCHGLNEGNSGIGGWNQDGVYVQKEGNNKDCNIGWHLFGSLCYYIETKKRKWTSARDNCKIMGARLATIRNQTQEGFLETLISASCLPVMKHWFGGRYSKPLGQWTWVSGEPFEYRNWDKAIGEPDRNLNCCMVKASNGLWRDRLCDDFFHYSVCEKLAVYH
ncbi:ladderlectin-like [Mya arenaria]|uniref:ladderlectin-like n=1 Tax=Mya arenaria TaxID=6604 RepID=UPI0022DFFFE5|nr:ladderlectin-like [Mya arenaria]